MNDATTFWTTLLVTAPAIAGIRSRLTRRGPRATASLTMGGSAASLTIAAWLLSQNATGVASLWRWAPDLLVEVTWRLDVATLSIACLVSGIGLLILQFCGQYFASKREAASTVALLAIFESAMLGLVLADNLLQLYILWELTGICSFFLISSDRSKAAAGLRAASHALLVTVAGGLSMLAGFLYLSIGAGSASLSHLLTLDLDPHTATVALALILPGALTKSAQVPTHFWLPGAMAAPTPVSAYLHSATMVKAGLILLLYLYPLLGASPLWTAVLLPAGAATCIWGSLRALKEADIKLLMAWSTVSQLGLITLTMGLGTDVAIRAAVLHLFAHAIFKAGLFLTVGGVDHAAHTRSLLELGGLWRRTPVLTVAAAVLAGSMAGIPPLAGFLSKELILKKAMLTELWVHSVAISAIVIGSIGTVAYSSRYVFEVFTGEPRSEGARRADRLPAGWLMAPLALAVLTVLAGPAAPFVDRWFLEPVAFAIVGAPLEVKSLSLWYGINAALLLSVAIVAVGFFSDRAIGLRFIARRRERRPVAADVFDSMLEWCGAIGERIAAGLAGASPRLYLGLTVALGCLPGWLLLGSAASFDRAGLRGFGALAVVALALLLVALVAARGRLPRVLLLTAVGFCVAGLFRLLNGPDLMLTQLLVEVLLTTFFALALWALPTELGRGGPEPGAGQRIWRVLLGIGAGTGAALWVAGLNVARPAEEVADYLREVAPVVGQGDNLVNVVLADVRALDTLMETVVVVLGALGVVALLHRHERADRMSAVPSRNAAGTLGTGRGLLPCLGRAILPIGALLAIILLLKGHNEPGGGFVAGLALGATSLISLAAYGPYHLRRRTRVAAPVVAVLGIGLMLASGALGWLAGRPYLTQLHHKLYLGGFTIPLHSAMLFDLGVMLAVAGSVAAAGTAFWITATAGQGGKS